MLDIRGVFVLARFSDVAFFVLVYFRLAFNFSPLGARLCCPEISPILIIKLTGCDSAVVVVALKICGIRGQTRLVFPKGSRLLRNIPPTKPKSDYGSRCCRIDSNFFVYRKHVSNFIVFCLENKLPMSYIIR